MQQKEMRQVPAQQEAGVQEDLRLVRAATAVAAVAGPAAATLAQAAAATGIARTQLFGPH